MVTSQFNKISPAIYHGQKGIFNVLPLARECLPFNLGKCKQNKPSVSSGFKIINKDVFTLEGKGGEQSHFYYSPE